MFRKTALVGACVLGFAAAARADFSGQPIFGPITLGSIVNGDTTGAADLNDGFSSGGHFFDIWTGPDNVWQLNWPGGDMSVTLTGTGGYDLDLFLYTPDSYDDSGNYSIFPDTNELILAPASDPGVYYLVVDSAGDAGAYQLAVTSVPEPTSLAAIALGVGALLRRRR